MQQVINLLIENPSVSKVVFVQQRNWVYDWNQISLLSEIATLYNYFVKELNLLSTQNLTPFQCKKCLAQRFETLRYLLLTLLLQDPISCFVSATRICREEKINYKHMPNACLKCQLNWISILENIKNKLEETKLIKLVKDKLAGYKLLDRTIYEQIFRPVIIPNFAFTKLLAKIPSNAEIIDQYEIGSGWDKSQVTILKIRGKPKYIYHLMPPEYTLSEAHYNLINLARETLMQYKPKREETTDPELIRTIFSNIAKGLLSDLAKTQGIKLDWNQLQLLSSILVRHTIGFGLLEVLLQDEKLQDIIVNAPPSRTCIFVRHQDWDECDTNVYPAVEDVESWAAKFRMLSGRPLDEAHPILDTELNMKKARARVAIIQQPLSPYGIAYAFRRHRDKPWTLPLFIKHKMLNSLAAGLLSFLIDGARTMLIAGTRSSGKTSLLQACMLEIMSKYRIIVIEDTLELPVDSFRDLGYDILRMKVRSALFGEGTEVSAADGIRTSLRLGDSCLIIGEVRSEEAIALYEAMRVGALANVVAGTIHGASPYGVFDRVVNDLKVPITSFKATDIIVVNNPIKSPDGLHRWRRTLQISEVRKHWSKDPLAEGAFADLMLYDPNQDQLKPTSVLLHGESEIMKSIAAQVRGWAGSWDRVWENVKLRARIKQALVDLAFRLNRPELVEAEWVVKSNNLFHQIWEDIQKEIGFAEPELVFEKWQTEMKKILKSKLV